MSTDLSAIADALRGMPGIAAAAVEADETGDVGALRVVLDPGMDELEAASTVSRFMQEHFATDVGPERVHVVDDVAPVRPPASLGSVPQLPSQRSTRPAIVRTGQVVAGLEVTATVVLSSGMRFATGEGRTAATEQGMQRAMAMATLRALEHLVRDQARMDLEHLEVSTSGGVRTVLVSLTMVSARGAERLTGATTVREDEGRAVVRATLDAVNRRLEALLV
jgi:hypothetical protein